MIDKTSNHRSDGRQERQMRRALRVLRWLALSALLLLRLGGVAQAQTLLSTAKTWQRWEQVIPTNKSYTGCNPYRDVVLTVTYTSPGGQTYTGYGFWDGTNPLTPGETQFRLRASFPTAGTWTWVTQRSGGPSGDVCGSDAALAPRNGQVDVTASAPGRPPINTLGGLQVGTAAPNPGRYLMHSNGTPFFWLGDTNWYGSWRMTAAEWSNYLDQAGPPAGRGQQGFTVIQISMPLDALTGAQTQPVDAAQNKPFVDSGCTGSGAAIPRIGCRWNPAFWQEFDRKINEANNKGFVVVLVGLFKRVVEKKDGAWQPWPELAEAKLYARSVAARLAGNHVIFSPGFDEAPLSLSNPLSETDPSCNNTGVGDVNLACRARAIGNVIRTGLVRSTADLKPLIGLVTHHIGGGCKSDGTCCTADYWLAQFQGESWLDFQLFQSGQGKNCLANFDGNNNVLSQSEQLACLTERARERPQELYALSSPAAKPSVNGEGIYDGLSGSPLYDDNRARQVGYFSRLSGAFGHTLGVEGTWNWGMSTKTLNDSLGSASSAQAKHLCTLFRNLEWQKLVPKPGRVFGQAVTTSCDPPTTAESTKMVYSMDGTPAWAGGGRFALAYLSSGSSSVLELDTSGLASFGSAWCQQWFNPRTGTYSADFSGTPVAGTTRYRFTKPDAEDWALLLKDPTLPCWTTPPQFCPCRTASGGQYVCSPTP